MDTVGAVCMDSHGHLCAGVSSGGVVYKTPGRIGQVRLPHYCSVTIPPPTPGGSCHIKRNGVLIGHFENNP